MRPVSILSLTCFFATPMFAADKFYYSGFLSRYPSLEADPNFDGAYKWSDSNVDLNRYSRFMVAPIEIWISPDSEYKGLTADQMHLINLTFQTIVRDELEPEYPIVSKPGDGVLVLRVAMTNVKLKEKERGFTSWLPPSLVYRGLDNALNAALENIELQHAQIEGELRDAMGNDLVAMRLVTGVGKEGKEMHIAGFIDFMRYRAKQFRAALDRAKRK